MIGAESGDCIVGVDVFDGSRGGRLTVACSTTGYSGGTAEREVTVGSGCEFKIGTTCK